MQIVLPNDMSCCRRWRAEGREGTNPSKTLVLKTSVLTYKLWIILLLFFHWGCPWISSLWWISSLIVLVLYSPAGQGPLTLRQEVVGDRRVGPFGIWARQSKLWSPEVLVPLSKRILLETKTSWFTCLELCPEISNESSQLELLETLYLPLSKEEGQPRKNCCLILAAANNAVCLHSWKAWEGREGGKKNRRGKQKGKKCVMQILKIQSRGNSKIKIKRFF